MKKLSIVLLAFAMLVFFAVPAMAAATLTEGLTGVFNEAVLGVIKLLSMAVLGLITLGVQKLLKKWKLEQYEGTVIGAAEDAIFYAEEWARKRASERGYAVAGAEKFDKAYMKMAAKLPFLDSEAVKEALVVNLAKVRDYGLEKGRQSLQDKLDELQNGSDNESEDAPEPTE